MKPDAKRRAEMERANVEFRARGLPEIDPDLSDMQLRGGGCSIGLLLCLSAIVLLVACVRGISTPACPTATPDPRMAEISTSIAALETVVPSLLETVVAMPTCASLDATPAPINTPPAPEICKNCSLGGRECATGLTCAYCPELGYRCVDPASVNGSCTTCRLQAAEWPIPVGLATWYNDSAMVATGERFEPSRLTCAVDVAFWPVLAGQSLRVTRLDTGASIIVAVNDCGYLSRAGQFEYAVRGGVARWWSCAQGFEIVVDLSPAAADALTGRETVLVQAEVVK